MLPELQQLHQLLVRIAHPRSNEIARLIELHSDDPDQFWQAINGNALWAGAGSLASQTLSRNPGLSESVWRTEVREFRALLIAIGEQLMARGGENPGISSWLLAFQNWNISDV